MDYKYKRKIDFDVKNYIKKKMLESLENIPRHYSDQIVRAYISVYWNFYGKNTNKYSLLKDKNWPDKYSPVVVWYNWRLQNAKRLKGLYCSVYYKNNLYTELIELMKLYNYSAWRIQLVKYICKFNMLFLL